MSRGLGVYGIDFGTTYSCIAITEGDGFVNIIDLRGDYNTPSVVALDVSGKWIVGRTAKSRLGLGKDPDNVVAFIKREISNPDFKCILQGKEFSPLDISSRIIKQLVDFANKKRFYEDGKPPITDVVMTYPACFDSLERERILESCKMAGLNVLQCIDEPMATALWYGRRFRDNKVLLIYDLGGGTFDVSIMKIEKGVPECLSTRGDHHLGQVDWDRVIVDYALNEVGAKWEDLDKATQGMLMNAAEETRKIISDPDEKESVLTFNFNGVRNVTIRRGDFEARTASLMQRTKGYVQEALDVAGMQSFDIDEVIISGGSFRMPMVSKMLQSLFPDSEVKTVDPNFYVAKGAAYYGSLIATGY